MVEGCLFLIVGNSGSGKDSILDWVKAHWSCEKTDIIIAERYITRPPAPETEKFVSVSQDEFKKIDHAGQFALKWNSYDMWYGVPREIVSKTKQGALVIVNVSRQIIEDTREQYPGTKVIFVSVPVSILLDRIKQRARESDSEIAARLDRAKHNETMPGADFVVENTGTVAEAGARLLAYLEQFC
nr:hypothetical protein [Candidatus Sigynarchaeota archaeon]